MTFVPQSSMSRYSRREDKNFEMYFLIWLDASINSEENLAAQEETRSAINYLQIFDQLDECERYIRSISPEDRIVFIVSGHFGQHLVPEIHQLRQVFSIYIYCRNKEFHKDWSERYRKIKGVHDRLEELVRQIQSDQSSRRQIKDAESLSFQILNSKSNFDQSTTGLDGRFLQSQLLISYLLKMKKNPVDQMEFISQCRHFYKGNAQHLKSVTEFEERYAPEHSLWWYTSEKFLYRILNKALRSQNIDLLFLLRFFIHDVPEEVLFQIDADPRQCGVKPFADVSKISPFTEEEEILMMLGSIFRVKKIFQDENQLWHIQMILCSENDCDLRTVFHHMKNQ